MTICRILNGMWQVSGAHGVIDPGAALEEMFRYLEAGFTTWDLADHYGPAEEFIAQFLKRLEESSPEKAPPIQAFTKWVPRPMPMTREVVEAAVARSLRRMGVDALDLLQFHWWDYENPAYLDALRHLSELQEAGKIRHLGLTNFDTAHLEKILHSGIPVISNQVQYSLVDLRPEARMVPFCAPRKIWLLTYGTLCGGLLSEKYLGKPEPGTHSLETASLRKYKQMVDAWGGWELFQELLRALKGIAEKHRVSISNVAVRFVLDRPAVAGVIVGTRLGQAEHRLDNARVFDFALDDQDRAWIFAVTSKSQDLLRRIGDCGDEYRA